MPEILSASTVSVHPKRLGGEIESCAKIMTRPSPRYEIEITTWLFCGLSI
jgi:hypothetical protein